VFQLSSSRRHPTTPLAAVLQGLVASAAGTAATHLVHGLAIAGAYRALDALRDR